MALLFDVDYRTLAIYEYLLYVITPRDICKSNFKVVVPGANQVGLFTLFYCYSVSVRKSTDRFRYQEVAPLASQTGTTVCISWAFSYFGFASKVGF